MSASITASCLAINILMPFQGLANWCGHDRYPRAIGAGEAA